MWQDYALSAMGAVFAVSLIPSIISNDKPAIATSLMNCFGVMVNTIVFFTLDLWLSFLASAIIFILWSVLAIQKYCQKVIKV